MGILSMTVLASCHVDNDTQSSAQFTLLNLKKSGIEFSNDLVPTEEVNTYTFRNFYNGAGVGLADLNNDGWVDIFFAGNQTDNKLYLNKGNLEFVDITEQAGVASPNVWSTGVSIADVNGDGWLDIYVCKSGDINTENRHNELFINQGVSFHAEGIEGVTFQEESKRYGLDDKGLSTHAAFFDYDLDGDLDCYLLNNSFRSVGNYDLIPDQREIRDLEGGNKLFKNRLNEEISQDQNIFEDVSEYAGIYGSFIGFGLGVTTGDVNNDGWPDIFVSNDFFEKDYLYINQKNGRFVESVESTIQELSMGSMGADIADINNDGNLDIFVTEMLPKDERRLKSKAQFENWNKYAANIRNGYHRQFGRNVLNLNNGDGTFAEVGRYAGVEATDWSWGALLFDMDNDGFKDIFVANGIFKDLLDQDYINFFSDPAQVRKVILDESGGILSLLEKMPSEPLPNAVFRNLGDLKFEEVSQDWGLAKPTFSNGSAYADLDNDGDLDLVINNINESVDIYLNHSSQPGIQVNLFSPESLNRYEVGARIKLFHDDIVQTSEVIQSRGFMSSVPPTAHFGLGASQSVDSIWIYWTDGSMSKHFQLPIDTQITITHSSMMGSNISSSTPEPLFKLDNGFSSDFIHRENTYSDFDREPLLMQMHSNLGPCSCVGDLNSDRQEDIFIGGASGQTGQIFLQTRGQIFTTPYVEVLNELSESEAKKCVIFDANGDGLNDMYLAMGSSEFGANSNLQRDHLLLNKGNMTFEISNQVLPSFKFENSSDVEPIDYDLDGDLDLIVGTSIIPFSYGLPGSVYILENDGSGNFTERSNEYCRGCERIGMTSDIEIFDFDNDGDMDFAVVGYWMPIVIFENREGRFTKLETEFLDSLTGIWNCLVTGDFDQDGLPDLAIGNFGLNSRVKSSKTRPLKLYVNDFDQNGRVDPIFAYTLSDGEYPFAQRSDLLKQIPSLTKQFPDFNSYAKKTITQIFTSAQLQQAIQLHIQEMRSIVLWNLGGGSFSMDVLPTKVQMSQVLAIHHSDVNEDGISDLILGGNQSSVKPELGSNLANTVSVLLGRENRKFSIVPENQTGLNHNGELRSIQTVNFSDGMALILAKNNSRPELYRPYEQ